MPEIQPEPVGEASVDLAALRDSLAAGRSDEAAALFHAHDARAPRVVWRPALVDLNHPVLRSFFRGCGAPAGPVAQTWIDSEEFAALADWCRVLEVARGGGDYVYRHYGAEIARVYQADMTGRRVSDIGGHVSAFFRALYEAAARRREPVKSVHEPPRQVFVRAWRRLIVPLQRGEGPVDCFVAANVPDNELRAGLDVMPDPVMVVAPTGEVCYANRAACLTFGGGRGPQPGVSLHGYAGLDLALPDSPDRLILQGTQRKTCAKVVRGGVLVPLEVTVGATYYRDMPFFVIAVRDARR